MRDEDAHRNRMQIESLPPGIWSTRPPSIHPPIHVRNRMTTRRRHRLSTASTSPRRKAKATRRRGPRMWWSPGRPMCGRRSAPGSRAPGPATGGRVRGAVAVAFCWKDPAHPPNQSIIHQSTHRTTLTPTPTPTGPVPEPGNDCPGLLPDGTLTSLALPRLTTATREVRGRT